MVSCTAMSSIFIVASQCKYLGVDLHVVDKLVDGAKVRTQIWDTAGQERYSAVTNLYYRNAHGVVLVYDITNHQTFRNIPRRLEEARRHVAPESVIMLVGNKLDLRHLRTVETGEGRDYADQEEISFIEASAADSTNVVNIFDSIINQMLSVSQRTPRQEEEELPTVKIRREKKDEKLKKRLQKCCQ